MQPLSCERIEPEPPEMHLAVCCAQEIAIRSGGTKWPRAPIPAIRGTADWTAGFDPTTDLHDRASGSSRRPETDIRTRALAPACGLEVEPGGSHDNNSSTRMV